MAIFKCKMCGGALEVASGVSVIECEYCGTQQTLPKLDDDRRANMYDRANHFRRNNEFDKAMSIYESILNEDSSDAEAYWSLVLCRYGIEYVEDPSSHKRIPTVNRAQFTSIFDDNNYKSAIQYADSHQKALYEAEANAINEIQKGILAISQKEEPFDVFICYKETDHNGRRTPDSVLANDLYHQLTQEGFKVFFSRITLEDKLGSAYEPYIFAALNSAKVMVVLGTKAEYFNAVWVKNEWSRFLSLIKNGAAKTLIPAYRDMDPYDLPEEFSHLQAQDMSKLGFMQDLIRGIKKICQDSITPVKQEAVYNTSGTSSLRALVDRGNMALEDAQWDNAQAFFDQALNLDAHCGEAYLGCLLASVQCSNVDSFADVRLGRYKNPTSNTINACEENNTLINQIVTENTVPGFLSEGDIRKLFVYNYFNISSKTSSCFRNYEAEEQYLQTNKLLYRATQFLPNETKIKLNKQVDTILQTLSAAIKKEEEQDTLRKNKIKQEYEEYCSSIIAKVCAMASDAREKRDKLYTEACALLTPDSSLADLNTAIKKFEAVGEYLDTKERIQECEKNKNRIIVQARVREEARKRRKTVITVIAVFAVIVGIVAALFISSIQKIEPTRQEIIGQSFYTYFDSGVYDRIELKIVDENYCNILVEKRIGERKIERTNVPYTLRAGLNGVYLSWEGEAAPIAPLKVVFEDSTIRLKTKNWTNNGEAILYKDPIFSHFS